MSLQDLVEGDCGGSNSLVQLSSHFVQDHGLKDQDLRQASQSDQNVTQSFLSATTGELADQFFSSEESDTFKMDNILAEMRNAEMNFCIQEDPWPEQLAKEIKNNDYLYDPNIWSSTENKMLVKDDVYEYGYAPEWVKELESSHNESNALKSQSDFEKNGENESKYDTNFTDSVLHDDLNLDSYSEMMMNSINCMAGQYNEPLRDSLFAYRNFQQNVFNDLNHQVLEFNPSDELVTGSSSLKSSISAIGQPILANEILENTTETTNNEDIDRFLNETNNFQSWYSEYEEMKNAEKAQEYAFNSDNEMESIENPLAEGKRRLEAGELPIAVLCFEAAVKHDMSNAEAWQLLGTTQAENEQDNLAISALNKCLELEPNNLTAILCLAACYTNESCNLQACRTLKEWLNQNPKYTDIVKSKPILDESNVMKYLFTTQLYESIKDMYIEAAQRSVETGYIDADVQNGLGVLLNLNNENDKAVDCFKAALQIKPEDARLWNRLGATLANGGRCEEAIEAYRNALELCPGFVRARYNLGITCIHLDTYKEAIEHLLEALNQQASAISTNSQSPALSETIWSTLRLAISMSERSELLKAVNDRNLNLLNEEFNYQGSTESTTI
ncbi:peroxisomal targeting signal 1 receptor-like isoform X1 [Daktulosphaira vitifoliae]|uniref:peroxisomal targeting signal 1 receptor-like isoform X1 n=1 Tax=Daktulosphaira vitifoliae TaxID=58002 RepID=UPI0021A9CA3B|nr:peroxisomal targeting signal 1 receptor-like isoform X1 [Daktulosphaira vitifoliae]